MFSIANIFKKSAPVAVAPAVPTHMNVSDEKMEEVVSILTAVGFIDDSSLRHHMLSLNSYNGGSMEYTERSCGMRFWIDRGVNNTFRKITVVKHGYTSNTEEQIVSANQKLVSALV